MRRDSPFGAAGVVTGACYEDSPSVTSALRFVLVDVWLRAVEGLLTLADIRFPRALSRVI